MDTVKPDTASRQAAVAGRDASAQTGRTALVFCVHHKPWLMMSTLITTMIQEIRQADLFFIYNVGNGSCLEKPSYQPYRDAVAAGGANVQLSPFDERVREVCRIGHGRVVELQFENDHALDSGAWYKFIRTGRWRPYDYVLFLGEGALFTSPHTLSAMLELARRRNVHAIASGHEKRRLPKDFFMHYNTRSNQPTTLEIFHDQMVQEVFAVFCRDPAFRALVDRWPSTITPETQDHVPDIWGRSRFLYALRNAADSPGPSDGPGARRMMKRWLQRHRSVFPVMDEAAARWALRTSRGGIRPLRSGSEWMSSIHVDGARRPLEGVTPWTDIDGVHFHRTEEPEWFGCATIHLFSRQFLADLSERLERYQLYDAIELPFAGTALEVVWGFLPPALGYEKWFTDGFHRVRKHFVTYRREDDPEGMASYINRYYRGLACVRADGDYVKLRAYHRAQADLRGRLNPWYFDLPSGGDHDRHR